MLNYIVSNIALQSRKTIMAELACFCFSVALIFHLLLRLHFLLLFLKLEYKTMQFQYDKALISNRLSSLTLTLTFLPRLITCI